MSEKILAPGREKQYFQVQSLYDLKIKKTSLFPGRLRNLNLDVLGDIAYVFNESFE